MAHHDSKFDRRFRWFRVSAYLGYIAIVAVFSCLIIISVVRSVVAMTVPHRPPSETTLTVGECLERGTRLWTELEARRKSLGDRGARGDEDRSWATFRREWLERHREGESLCAMESRDRQNLKAVYKRLEQAMDLYTTHSVQYHGEIGPTVDALQRAMEQARVAPIHGL